MYNIETGKYEIRCSRKLDNYEINGVAKKKYSGQYLYDDINMSYAFTGSMTVGTDFECLKPSHEWLGAKTWEYGKIFLITFEEGCLTSTVNLSENAEILRAFYEEIRVWECNPWELKRRTAIKRILEQWDELIQKKSLGKSWRYPPVYDNYEVMQQTGDFDISRRVQEKELKIPPFLQKK